jgi:hypothetical protein
MKTEILKTPEEKAEFLDNDFIERLIRIEQKVSAKFGKLIRYQDTYCYKNLTSENKERYEKFLRAKKKKRFAFLIGLVLPMFGVLALSNSITGNVVREGVGAEGVQGIYFFLLGFFILVLAGSGVLLLIRRRKEKKFGSLFVPLENLVHKKKGL